MVLFAGPIVIEWYWIPIIIVVTFVVPMLTVGVISEFVLRAPRRSGPLTWTKQLRMWEVVGRHPDELRTPGGISVYFAAFRSQFSRRTAFAVHDGTLVRLIFEPMEDKYVLAYFDSLRPVDTNDIEFRLS